MIDVDVKTLDGLLDALARSGHLWVVRRPQRLNEYVFLFAGESVPRIDLERYRRFMGSHR